MFYLRKFEPFVLAKQVPEQVHCTLLAKPL